MSVTITPHYEHELVNQELGELPLDDQYIEHGISDIEEYLAGHVSEQLDPNDVRQEVSEAYAGIVASREAEDAGNMQREIAKATADGRAAIAKQEQSKRLYGWASSAVKSAAKAGDRLGFMGMLSRGVKGAERAASMTTTRRTSGERYFMGGHVRYDALHPTRRLMRESKIRRIEDDIRRRIKRVVPNASKEDLDSAMRGEGQKGLSGFEKAASRRSLYRSRHGLTRGANKEAAGLITERLRERGVRREGEHTYHDLPTKSESDNPRHRRRSPNSPGDGREGYRPMRFRPEHTPQPAEKPEQPSRSVFDFYIEPIDEETANQELLEQQPVEEDQEVIARK